MDPQAYLRHRRTLEVGLWILLAMINGAGNAITLNMDFAQSGAGVARWEPWIWEFSSGFTWLGLVPLLLAFDRRFPLERGALHRSVPAHLLFTVPYSLLHVLGMVALREMAYTVAGGNYDFGDWMARFGYEYLKDVRTYGAFLATIYLYRFVLRRWQGEAGFINEGVEDAAAPVTDRFLVKKLGREFLVKVNDIDWIEASGNYVNLRVGDRVYPLRETMAGIQAKLDGLGFARVHRSAIVNLDRVREIEPFDTGDARAHLTGGGTVPVSRRYRQALKERLA